MSEPTTTTDLERPIAINYLVIPHVPEGLGTLLSKDGEPVMMDYATLDWRSLADALKARLEGLGLPKAIKVYVANDGVDLFDINETYVATGEERQEGPFFSARAAQCLDKVTKANYRAGVIDLSQVNKDLHLNPPNADGLRPPLAALMVSLRFNTMSQCADYGFSATQSLFGAALPMTPEAGTVEHGHKDSPMCDELRHWLDEQIGVVYAPQATVALMGPTRF